MLLNQFHDILPGSCIKQVQVYFFGTVRLIHSKPDESENGDLNVHFGFVFEENSVSEITR